MIKNLILTFLILFGYSSYAQNKFALNYFYEMDDYNGQFVKIEYNLKNDSITGTAKFYRYRTLEFIKEEKIFNNAVDVASKLDLVTRIKKGIKNQDIILFDTKNVEFETWFENEKKKYKSYFLFILNGKKYYCFDILRHVSTNWSSETSSDLKNALLKWSNPRKYLARQKYEREEDSIAKINKATITKKPKLLVNTNPKAFKKIFISQLSEFENKTRVEIKLTIDNKGIRTKEIISNKGTQTKIDTIANFDVLKNELNELVTKEKIILQRPSWVRSLPAVGGTDGYIEIQMVDNILDHQDDKVEFVFSWRANNIYTEDKKLIYNTKIEKSSVEFLENLIYK